MSVNVCKVAGGKVLLSIKLLSQHGVMVLNLSFMLCQHLHAQDEMKNNTRMCANESGFESKRAMTHIAHISLHMRNIKLRIYIC